MFSNIFTNAKLKFAILNSIILFVIMGFFYYVIYTLYVDYAIEIIKNRSEDIAKVGILNVVNHRQFTLPPGFSMMIVKDGNILFKANRIGKDDKKTLYIRKSFEYQGNVYTVYLKASIEDIIESERKIIVYASGLFIVLTISVFGISYLFAGIFLKPIRDYTEKLDVILKGSMHAINTPLGVLKLLDIKDKKAKEAISRIEDTINRIKSISMSKAQEKTLLNINEAIKDMLDSSEDCLGDMKVILEEKTILKAYVDPVDFSMIVENLLINAIKYGHDFIRIKILPSKLIFENPSAPIKDIDKIFDLFYREDETKEGLGLGLYIVKRLCDRNDIKLRARYSEGIFQISLEW